MSRILITGSTEGLGRNAAEELLGAGHDIVVHARNEQRAHALDGLIARGADVVIGDLSSVDEVDDVAEQVNRLGNMDAVIHNAGVDGGRGLLPVNVVAPYLLTARINKPKRIVYLSSGMHTGGHANLDGIDWSGQVETRSYSDTKLFVTALTFYVARTWPDVYANAVAPGWVPTRMGGASATDDLRLGHVTQAWLASSNDPQALVSGMYWFHQAHQKPHPATCNEVFQDELAESLARYTGAAIS